MSRFFRSSGELQKLSTSSDSLLHTAITSNDRDRVRDLLKVKDLDLNAANSLGMTPLMAAANEGQLKICELLLDAGADCTRATEDGSVALTLLLKLGVPPSVLYLKVLTLLTDRGRLFANRTFKRDRRGEALIHSAAARPNVFNLQFLLLNGADANALTEHGRTPLHYAMYTREFEMAKLLLQHGVDLSVRDNSGKTSEELLVEIPGWHQALAAYLPSKTGDGDRELLEIVRAARRLLLREPNRTDGLQAACSQLTRATAILCDRLHVVDALELEEREAADFRRQFGSATAPLDAAATADLRRVPAVSELIRSEERNMQKLEALRSTFYDRAQSEEWCSEKMRLKLFANLPQVIDTFTWILRRLQDFERSSGPKGTPRLGPLLQDIAKSCDLYTLLQPYAKVCCAIEERVARYSDKKQFAAFAERGRTISGSSLAELLPLPLQRLSRYPALIEAILQQLPSTHAEYDSLLEAQRMFRTVNEALDDYQTGVQHKKELERIFAKIHLPSQKGAVGGGANEQRWLVLQGAIARCLEGETTESHHGFLLNDMLLLTKVGDKGKYTVVQQCPLRDSCLFDVPDVPSSIFLNAFQLVFTDAESSRSNSLTFVVDTAAMKKQWSESISDCLLSTLDSSKAMIKGDALKATAMEGFIVLQTKSISHRRFARLKGQTLYLFKDTKSSKWLSRFDLSDLKIGECNPSTGLVCLLPKSKQSEGVKFIAAGPIEYGQWVKQLEQHLGE